MQNNLARMPLHQIMKKKRRGAPRKNQNARKKQPMISMSIRGKPDQITRWLNAADASEMEFSEWVRSALDRSVTECAGEHPAIEKIPDR